MFSPGVLLVAFAGVTFALSATKYEGNKVYSVIPSTPNHVSFLKRLENHPEFDFWSKSRALNHNVDVMVLPNIQREFEEQLKSLGIQYSVMIDNVERLIETERINQGRVRSSSKSLNLSERYYTYDEINDYLLELAAAYPTLVQLEMIGSSYEGRELTFAKVSSNPNASNPIILIDGGIHAREWIAPSTVLYILQQLVESEANKDLLDGIDWYLLPVLNPDGYAFSHSDTRLWTKTRSFHNVCYGTDGNRNFDYFWETIGGMWTECEEIYRGPVARSEVETRNFDTFASRHANRIALYLSFHSYGQYILYPWGYIASAPENGDELQDLGDAAAAAIYAYGNTSIYTVGVSSIIQHPISGSSVDWVYGALGVPLAYSVELPSRGYGFLTPIQYVGEILRETFAGVREFASYVKKTRVANGIKRMH